MQKRLSAACADPSKLLAGLGPGAGTGKDPRAALCASDCSRELNEMSDACAKVKTHLPRPRAMRPARSRKDIIGQATEDFV